jgi:hypothetical protein
MFGRKKFPIPRNLPTQCPTCGSKLKWTPVTHFDDIIGIDKVDYYNAECSCGEVLAYDGRAQKVEPAVVNLAPDRSPIANSPQGPQPYPGTPDYGVAPAGAAPAKAPAEASPAT